MELKLDLQLLTEKVKAYMNRKEVWSHGFISYNILKKIKNKLLMIRLKSDA